MNHEPNERRTDAVSFEPGDEVPVEREALARLVADRLAVHWPSFAERHPHLARAISRITFIDVTVDRLADDPAFRRALAEAARDRATLAAAAEVAQVVDRWVRRLIGL